MILECANELLPQTEHLSKDIHLLGSCRPRARRVLDSPHRSGGQPERIAELQQEGGMGGKLGGARHVRTGRAHRPGIGCKPA